MRKVLIQFFIKEKKTNKKDFLFWSCVLESIVDNIDFSFINNKNNSYNIDGFNEYQVIIKYSEFTNIESIFESTNLDFNKVKSSQTFLEIKGDISVYYNACSRVVTYDYNSNDFLSNFKEFIKDKYNTDLKITKLLENILMTIKTIIGFNLFDCNSHPGAISVYDKLPIFNIDFCLNPLNKHLRYIDIKCFDNSLDLDNVLIYLILGSKDNIIYEKIFKYNEYNKYIDKTIGPFYSFSISVFNKSNNSLEIIYKNIVNCIKNINLSIGIYDIKKIVPTRYLGNKKTETIDTISTLSNHTIGDMDQISKIKEYIYGEKILINESYFFNNDCNGRKEFLDWVREITSKAKKILIVDPFFDDKAIEDLNSCINNKSLDINILTTYPEKRIESNSKLTNDDFEKKLVRCLKNVTIYYISRDKLHDRYLLVNSKKLYSLSNSWNGTVNNYSLLIQEIPYKIKLAILDHIEELLDKCTKTNLSKLSVKFDEDGDGYKKDLDNNDINYDENISHINKIEDLDKKSEKEIINYLLKFCLYYNDNHKYDIYSILFESLNKINKNKLSTLIELVINKILETENNIYISNGVFYNDKSLEYLNKNISELIAFIDLKLEYHYKIYNKFLGCIHVLAKTLFIIYPEEFIYILTKNENNIFHVSLNNDTINYRISSMLISSYIIDIYLNANIKYINILQSNCINNNFVRVFIHMIKLYFIYKKSNISKQLDFLDNCKESEEIKFYIFMSLTKEFSKKNELNKDIFEYMKKFNINYKLLFAHQILFTNIYYSDKCIYNDNGVDNFFNYIEYLSENDKNSNIELIENVILIESLRINTKIQNKLLNVIVDEKDKVLYEHILENKEIDFTRYMDSYLKNISKISNVLSKRLNDKKYIDLFITLNVYDLFLIFNTTKNYENSSYKITDYCYILYLLLVSLIFSYYNENQIKNIDNILKNFEWYIPVILNSYSYFRNNIDVNIIDSYLLLIKDNEEKKELLATKISNNIKCKALILSSLKNQKKDYITLYNTILYNSNHNEDVNFLSKLYIYLSINISSIESTSLKQDFISLLKILKDKNIENQKIKNILDYGFEFAINPTYDNKNNYIDIMINNEFYPFYANVLKF